MRAAVALVPVALLATSCGDKSDPYAKSLAMSSEHVEFHGSVLQGGARMRITGTGDFTNAPDRGRLTIVVGPTSYLQVFAAGKVYVRVNGRWVAEPINSRNPQSPAQMFRAHLPARIENGLVRSMTARNAKASITYDFSKYGEPVSVTIPRVKGSK